ncbi:MAG: HNH endonuclease signature motif containing protein, partial [Verrucomicrobiota bacterium]
GEIKHRIGETWWIRLGSRMDLKVCPLCEREIPPEQESRHHLVPRLKGGTHGPVVILHPSCHSKIHSVLSESDLARHYSTIESLQTHPEIEKFIRWIRKRPIEMRVRNRSLRRRQRNRKQ